MRGGDQCEVNTGDKRGDKRGDDTGDEREWYLGSLQASCTLANGCVHASAHEASDSNGEEEDAAKGDEGPQVEEQQPS